MMDVKTQVGGYPTTKDVVAAYAAHEGYSVSLLPPSKYFPTAFDCRGNSQFSGLHDATVIGFVQNGAIHKSLILVKFDDHGARGPQQQGIFSFPLNGNFPDTRWIRQTLKIG